MILKIPIKNATPEKEGFSFSEFKYEDEKESSLKSESK